MDSSFWKGKSVFVTGHTGFKGSWLCEWLILLGAKVHGFSQPPATDPSLFTVLSLEQRLSHRIGDVRSAVSLREELKASGASIVFHLAAQPLVRVSYREPRMTFDTNVMGTANLLDAVRSCPAVRAVVIVTTDKCYENREWVWGYRETDPLGGHDPYSASKACAEIVTAAYRDSFFRTADPSARPPVAVASARAGNVIGGGDWAEDRLVPDCARSLSAGRTVVVRNPSSTRPWQHVLEPLGGYLLLAERLWTEPRRFDEPWNFGPAAHDALTVAQVVSESISAWGSGESTTAEGASVHETRMLKLDISKTTELLGWKPRYDARKAIRETMRWYRAFYARREDIRALTDSQIASYSSASFLAVVDRG
jgi:CDP-glucose 4,6-dehydratase